MALFVSIYQRIVELPRSTLELLNWAWGWSATPMIIEPTSEIWADDLFPSGSTKCLLRPSSEDDTDSSGSEICGEENEDDIEWSSDEEWGSDNDEELGGFSFGGGDDIEFYGDRWFWSLSSDELTSITTSDDVASYTDRRLVEYAMPSIDLDMNTPVEFWVDKYGSSSTFIRVVSTGSMYEQSTVENEATSAPPNATSSIFVAVL